VPLLLLLLLLLRFLGYCLKQLLPLLAELSILQLKRTSRRGDSEFCNRTGRRCASETVLQAQQKVY
jgi:hypothetical protein